ncbi:hypothetical protein FH972_021690 [Carpinus fangiana]|uniref:Uncharacterized protein n=1 Tax=Carpinus fangiana TaxID=176857 RepID=A0A5N6KQ31_9ROSI|nr:hypothetical protein FH972_021690 [Carpinus fangiana]
MEELSSEPSNLQEAGTPGDEQMAHKPGTHDEAASLQHLATTVRSQDDLEKDIGRQADQLLLQQADERDQKRLERTQKDKDRILTQIQRLQQRLHNPGADATRIRAEIQRYQPQIDTLNTDLEQIKRRIQERHAEAEGAGGDAADTNSAGGRQPGESRRDFLIRTGKITPFSNMGLQSRETTSADLADVMLDAEQHDIDVDDDLANDEEDLFDDLGRNIKQPSHRNLLKPGFAEDESSNTESTTESTDDRPKKKRRLLHRSNLGPRGSSDEDFSMSDPSEDDYVPEGGNKEIFKPTEDSDSDMAITAQTADYDRPQRTKKGASKKRRAGITESAEDLTGLDDGNEDLYQARLEQWISGRRAARQKARAKQEPPVSGRVPDQVDAAQEYSSPEVDEAYLPHPTRPDTDFGTGFRIPGDIFPSLFDYQKVGVKWLWELYSQQVGGIIGDEMGLGKTIQAITFLAGLHYSKMLEGKPIIIVCPATVMKQWVQEFHRWWPPLRVSILHTSGSGMMNVGREREIEDDLEMGYNPRASKPSNTSARRIVDRVLNEGHVLVTTYSGLQTYADLLIPVQWQYAVLDEGHKIRNPNTSITIHCKELKTANRVILSGTPMQNNLGELWSLFDFVFPMRLGTLVNFRMQFEIPIKQGGYANASNLQVETALKCAETLKDTISPYLLQRFKVDVAADLPKKSEQVLFCKLTKLQREAYEMFLDSNEMRAILDGRRNALYGIDMLRKICNHPDLQQHRHLSVKPGYKYGVPSKSGKMQVVKALLQLWRDTGHKTLLFAQHRIMLDILELFIKSLGGFKYRRMDGNTAIKDRQDMVDEFNKDPDLHVFLLTTKVGGLGVNLVGADRVIIYDPDWNPSTDVQARERAWRLGQQREVMIYRLMTAGTIEEKIYHRQIFKQFLTNKILRDPKQRQTFQLKDLHDLFTLGNDSEEGTETSGLFKGSAVENPDQHAHPTPAVDATVTADATKVTSIKGVSHSRVFEESPPPAPPQPTSTADAPTTNGANNHLMSTLFSRAGVHSAVSHDAIISGGTAPAGKLTADPDLIRAEAKRVAALAARELALAGESARAVPVGTPTWTGTHGVAGRPPSPPPRGISPALRARGAFAPRAGGPSGAHVLSNLAARQGAARGGAAAAALSRGATPGSDGSETLQQQQQQQQQPKGKDFMVLIRDFLRAQPGGSAPTQMLIDHFNRFCRTEARTAEFKEMLRVIATLERGEAGAARARGRFAGRGGARMAVDARAGRARWVLKREYGGSA